MTIFAVSIGALCVITSYLAGRVCKLQNAVEWKEKNLKDQIDREFRKTNELVCSFAERLETLENILIQAAHEGSREASPQDEVKTIAVRRKKEVSEETKRKISEKKKAYWEIKKATQALPAQQEDHQLATVS